MGSDELIPPDIRRFILTSIDSVPHLEALLILRYDPKVEWDAKGMSQRLYISEKRTVELLENLLAAGFVAVKRGDVSVYYYSPVSEELRGMMTRLADIYAKQLVEVTNLIHSNISKQAQQFGDAFKWQKEKD